MADIDSLQININATATKANDAIDRLVVKLDRLTTSLSKIDGSKLNGLASGVSQLGTAMQTMNNVKTADFTRLAKNLSNLNNLDTSKLSGVSANISKIGTAVSGLSGVSQGVSQITELANGIKQLGYKSADKAIDNIPKLATSMSQLMKELSTAPKVSQNLIDMTNALAKLARTGASSGKAAQSLSNSFTGVYKSSGFAVSGIKKVNARLTNLIRSIAPVVGLVKLIDFGKQAMEISSDLTEVQNVVDVTFGQYKQKIEDLANVSIPELGMSKLSVKEIGSRFQAMGTAMGFAQGEMADMSVQLTRLTGDMASFYNASSEDVGKALQSVFTGETEPMRKYGIDLTNATIQQYALSQGITTSVNKMTQLEKATLRYQYVMAQTNSAQGDFIRTQDTWANQVRMLTENLKELASVIGGALINAFKPLVSAMNQVAQYAIAFAETVTNALGAIFGWKYESGGGFGEDWADGMEDYSNTIGDAADNAKKLKQNLLGIDELNINSGDSDSSDSGSSGIGGIGDASASYGQIVPTETIFENYESSIKSLEELGNTIRDTLISAMDKIEWESVYEKARNFGTGLADFLNGLLAYDGEGQTLFGKVAETLAKTLNSIVYFAQSFAIEFDFYQFGVNLGDAINKFFEEFDFEALADTLNLWVDGLKEAIRGFLDTVTWDSVLQGAKDFLGNLEIDTIEVIIGTMLIKRFGVVKIGSAALRWFTQNLSNEIKDYWTEHNTLSLSMFIKTLGFDLGKIITINPENWAHLWALFEDNVLRGTIFDTNTWEGLPAEVDTAIDTAIDTVGNYLVEAMKETITTLFNWDETKQLFEQAKENFSKGGENIFLGIVDGFAGAIAFILEPVKDTFTALWDEICRIFGIHSPAEEMKPLGEYIFLGITEGFSSMFETFTESMTDFWDNYIASWFTLEKWYELGNGILEGLQTKWEEISTWWRDTAIFEWWENDVKPWFSLETWLELLSSIKESFETKWNETVGQWILNIQKWWKDNVEPWFTKKKWSDMLQSIPTVFKETFKSAANGAIGFLNSLIEGLESMVNSAIKMLFELASVVNKIPGVNIEFEVPQISLPRIPTFSTGGFPEDGLFFANHNELVGEFSNGKTAVANNEQITEGIKQGVKEAVAEILAPYLAEIAQNTRETADKDFDVSLDSRSLLDGLNQRRSRNGFSFT